MIRRVFFHFFWNLWDNLGGWLLVSLAAFVAALPLVTAPAAWGGLLTCAARADRQQDVGLGDFLNGFRRYGWRSTLFGLMLVAGGAIGLFNALFYALSPLAAAWPLSLRFGLTGVFIWLVIFFTVGMNLAWGFMTLQDCPMKTALRRGFLVLSAHPLTALWAMTIALPMVLALVVSVIGVIFLLGAALANLVMAMVAGALDHHEAMEDAALRGRIKAGEILTPAETEALRQREEARRIRYDRGLHDIIKPWDMRS